MSYTQVWAEDSVPNANNSSFTMRLIHDDHEIMIPFIQSYFRYLILARISLADISVCTNEVNGQLTKVSNNARNSGFTVDFGF